MTTPRAASHFVMRSVPRCHARHTTSRWRRPRGRNRLCWKEQRHDRRARARGRPRRREQRTHLGLCRVSPRSGAVRLSARPVSRDHDSGPLPLWHCSDTGFPRGASVDREVRCARTPVTARRANAAACGLPDGERAARSGRKDAEFACCSRFLRHVRPPAASSHQPTVAEHGRAARRRRVRRGRGRGRGSNGQPKSRVRRAAHRGRSSVRVRPVAPPQHVRERVGV
jgi:hypothetical protein